MMINQKQSTLLREISQISKDSRLLTKHSDITIKMNHRQLIKIENYSNITRDQCLMESIKCVNKIEV